MMELDMLATEGIHAAEYMFIRAWVVSMAGRTNEVVMLAE